MPRGSAGDACKEGKRVRLYIRPSNNLTTRFPLIGEMCYGQPFSPTIGCLNPRARTDPAGCHDLAQCWREDRLRPPRWRP
jgi:hypothetical protein